MISWLCNVSRRAEKEKYPGFFNLHEIKTSYKAIGIYECGTGIVMDKFMSKIEYIVQNKSPHIGNLTYDGAYMVENWITY